MNYEFGDIILISFPFTDLSTKKVRPALVISYKNLFKKDLIAAAISSRIYGKLSEREFLIKKESSYFAETGLKVSSIIKLDKISTIDKRIVSKKIGKLSDEVKNKIHKIICKMWQCIEVKDET